MEQVPVEAGPPLGPLPSLEGSGERGRGRFWRVSMVAVSLGAAAIALALDRAAPLPSADVSRGSEAAFVTGSLEPREIEGGIVRRRWAGATLVAHFVHLPAGPLELAVVLRGHQHPVMVRAAGAVLGVIPKERSRGAFAVPAVPGGRLTVTLETEVFPARGRRLGFMLERITLGYPPPEGLAPLSLFLVFLGPAWATLLASRLASLSESSASLLALAGALLEAVALWPEGIVRSAYATQLAWLLSCGVLAAALWVLRAARAAPRETSAATYGFPALVLALWVQGVAATHPCLVTSDGVFHANKVKAAAAGEYFPVSLTPHDPPYRFPYGVAFHLLVSPFLRAGVDAEAAVRGLAAISSLLASAILLRTLLAWGASRAALAVCLLQLLPTTFAPFSAGNFSNVFAQAVTVLFLCWGIGPHRGGWPMGAALIALAATAHFGAFLALLVLGPALLIVRNVGEPGAIPGPTDTGAVGYSAPRGTRDAQVVRAVAVGLGLAGLYYLQFLPLVASQLPRLLEGGKGSGPGIASSARVQIQRIVREWGGPVVVAALLGAVTTRLRSATLPPTILALWASGGVLALMALLSPLEVRYLYALGPAVALLAADGLRFVRGQRGGLFFASVFVMGQVWLAARGLVQAVVFTYRLPP